MLSRIRLIWLTLCFGLSVLIASSSVFASELKPANLPDPLKPWVAWVTSDIPEYGCPHHFEEAQQRWCQWPGSLELKIENNGASFKTQAVLFEPAWLTLVGDSKNWPHQVTVNNQVVAIAERDGRPAIYLNAGEHQVQGQLLWKTLPESLDLPAYAGVIKLQLSGQALPLSQIDQDHRLWLKRESRQDQQDDLQLSVFRKLIDGVPLQMETIYKLEVSGKSRELLLPHAILPDWIGLQITSALSSSLTESGDLKIQARTGNWEIRVLARHPANPQQISLPKKPESGQEDAAIDEIWVWQAAPSFRSISLNGLASIDAQQTNLPKAWMSLPAYLVQPGQTLQLKQNSRGENDNLPDKLALQRKIWLSFDGSIYSIQDHLDGIVNRAGRLHIYAPQQLGRVENQAMPVLITKGQDQQAGIELRRGNLKLVAESTLATESNSLAATGWQRDLDKLEINLQVPPGWRLFHAPGVDFARGSWLSNWNLASVFMVLLCSLAVYHLLGWRCAALALLSLILSHQESPGLSQLLLLSLALLALTRFLPDGRLQVWSHRIASLSLLGLLLLVLSYSIEQARSAIYPVLQQQFVEDQFGYVARERARSVSDSEENNAPESGQKQAEPDNSANSIPVPAVVVKEVIPAAPATAYVSSPGLVVQDSRASKIGTRGMNYEAGIHLRKKQQQQLLDPDSKVQTGTGMPSWGWHNYQLGFDGPVAKDQQFSLWLMPPWLNSLLGFLRIASIAALFLLIGRYAVAHKLARQSLTKLRQGLRGVSALFALGVLASLTALPEPAYASLPDEKLLERLKEKLTKPADCLPQCADLAKLQLRVEGQQLKLSLEIDAQAAVAFPIPASAKYWLPEQASYGGKPAYLQYDQQGQLLVLTQPGRHSLELSGQLLNADSLLLPLPHKPRRLEVQAQGWDWSGWSEENGAASSLQFTRKLNAQEQLKTPRLPAYLRVTRTIDLDKEWHVETLVEKVGDEMVALADIPLLDGESITTPGINLKDGKVQVNLSGKSANLSWVSNLKNNAALKLQAPSHSLWSERWVLRYQPVWHVDFTGVPPSVWQQGELAESEFRPWPGEHLQLRIERPQALPGQTLTIQNSTLVVTPGARSSDYALSLNLVSSQGGEHTINLPKAAQLLGVKRDGNDLALHQQNTSLLLPIVPGKQHYEIRWRSPQGISAWFSTETADLGVASVNHKIQLQLGSSRWLLFTKGAGVGPVILFWGQLLVLLLLALVLAKQSYLPLRRYEWLLLALGLAQSEVLAIVLVLIWFFAFAWRANLQPGTSRWRFNLLQLVLVALTLINLGIYLSIVYQGLLGMPDMQIRGNHSMYAELQWYIDRSSMVLPQVSVFSLSMLWYRALMLLWSLWLAWRLLQWLQWGWRAWSQRGYWRSATPKIALEQKQQSE